MHLKLPIILVLFILNNAYSAAQNLQERTWTFRAMGSGFAITAIHEDTVLADAALLKAKTEINRIEKLISSWDPNSETSQINKNAGIQPIKVSQELFNLVERSIKISELTAGAFDISYASMDRIWKFDGSMTRKPDANSIQASVLKVNYKNIILNKEQKTVFLKEKGMKIGFGAIGKGYAADKAKSLLLKMGIKNGMVNAGGDLIAWGKPVDAPNWRVGIASPKEHDQIIGWLATNAAAIVTSGDYEKFVIFDGVRYAHIINPKTGYPTTGVKSVTIVSPITEFGDALATAVFVLGLENGLSLVNQLKGVECLIIDDNDKIWTSEELVFEAN